MHILLLFAHNVVNHHLSWIGGLLTLLGVSELMLKKKFLISPKGVVRIGVAFLLIACCQAWFDEHRNVQTLIDEKAALTGQVAQLQAENAFKDKPIVLQVPPTAIRPHTGTSPKPAIKQSNSGGVNVQQTTAGTNSPIVNSPVTINPDVNPLAPVIIYDFRGNKKVIKEGGTNVNMIAGEQAENFKKMMDLQSLHDWIALKSFCESQMQKTPEWLTPVLLAGIAYANLGDKQRATELLTQVERKAAGDPAYQDATRILKMLKNEP
jgi:hypothetical protein